MNTTLTALLVLAVAPCALAAPPDRGELVSKHADPIIEKQLAPGMVVGIFEGGVAKAYPVGSMTYEGSESPDGNTVYEIGSISKVFTALLLADAEHRGELSENDTLGGHLPDGVELDGLESDEPIRLVNLSTHASGLPRMPPNNQPTDLMNPFADYDRTLMWEYLDGLFPQSAPNESYHYSNLAVGLLGTVIADNAGLSYEQLVVDRIAGPLGMSSTTITLNEDLNGRLAPPFKGTTPDKNWDFDALAGCGAIRSTVTDLLRLAEISLSPSEDGLPESLVDALVSTQSLRYSPGEGLPDVALGWHLAGEQNQVVWHNGGTGGYSTFMGINTENQTAVVVLANGSANEITSLGFQLIRELSKPTEEAGP